MADMIPEGLTKRDLIRQTETEALAMIAEIPDLIERDRDGEFREPAFADWVFESVGTFIAEMRQERDKLLDEAILLRRVIEIAKYEGVDTNRLIVEASKDVADVRDVRDRLKPR